MDDSTFTFHAISIPAQIMFDVAQSTHPLQDGGGKSFQSRGHTHPLVYMFVLISLDVIGIYLF
jgi:hypothetical protein